MASRGAVCPASHDGDKIASGSGQIVGFELQPVPIFVSDRAGYPGSLPAEALCAYTLPTPPHIVLTGQDRIAIVVFQIRVDAAMARD